MISKIFNQKIMVLFGSIIICFLLGELVVRIYLHNKTFYDIEMLRYSMIIKTDSKNPLICHVHRPNSKARLMDAMVQINSDGLRDKEYPLEKTDKERIIFLGDSLTFGWGVEQEDTFENILEQKLNSLYPAEIINFGTGNYNTVQEVNLFLEKGLKYRPDKVVLFYFVNDAEITPKKSRLWFLGYSRLISFYWSRIHAAFSNMVKSGSFGEYYRDLYRDDQTGWINAKKAFLQLKNVCQENNIALQVVLLPELHDTIHYPFKKEYGMVTSFLQDNSIPNLDLSPYFSNYENPMDLWVSIDDAHPNKLAHDLIAQFTLDFIK